MVMTLSYVVLNTFSISCTILCEFPFSGLVRVKFPHLQVNLIRTTLVSQVGDTLVPPWMWILHTIWWEDLGIVWKSEHKVASILSSLKESVYESNSYIFRADTVWKINITPKMTKHNEREKTLQFKLNACPLLYIIL